MRAERRGIQGLAIVLMVLASSRAEAQLCVGVPLGLGQTAVSLSAGFPNGANVFGARAANRLAEAIVVGAGYNLTSYDGGLVEVAASHTVGVDGALNLPVPALEEAGAGVCPVAGVGMTFHDGTNTLVVPLGVGLGASFPVSDGLALAPFVVPQLVWTRTSYSGNSFSDTEFGVAGGANLKVNNLFFGASVSKVGFGEYGGDAVFGVNAGVVF